jgi:glutaconate CoA-transferase subunit B
VTAPATDQERLAVWLSKDLVDGERIFLGANVNIGRAAALLANMTHAPALRVMVSLSWTNVADRTVTLFPDSTDHRGTRWAHAYVPLDTMISDYRYFSDVFVVDGLQVDPFGNSNLIGIGTDHERLSVRGPGAIGSLSSTTFAARFYLILSRHDPRHLVERCDFVSCAGWLDGSPGARQRAGIPSEGPRFCLTPLGVFDFPEEGRRMRLRRLLPDVTVDDVREATGFAVDVADDVDELPAPSDGELDILRNRIDRLGLLR